MASCTYLWCNLWTVVETTSQMDSGLWDSFFSMYFYHLWFRGRSKLWHRFCTIIFIVPETTTISFPTLPLCFPLPAFSFSSFSTSLIPATLNHCSFFSILSFLASKFRDLGPMCSILKSRTASRNHSRKQRSTAWSDLFSRSSWA